MCASGVEMMKVWAVEWWHGADSAIVGIYSTFDLAADALVRARMCKTYDCGDMLVSEHLVDSKFMNV